MSRLLIVALALTTLACSGAAIGVPPSGPAADTLGPGVHDVTMGADAEGEERTARVIWPEGDVKGALWIFHGGKNGSIDQMTPKWRKHHDRGWVLVFPQGQRSDKSKGAWFHAELAKSRHTPPLLRLHDRLTAAGIEHHAAAGFSSGASMVWRLACKDSDRFEAFVPVNNFLYSALAEECSAPVPPLLLIAATDDERMAYEGRPTSDGTPYNLGAIGSLKAWSKHMGCSGDIGETKESGGTRFGYANCALEHLRIDEGGHSWPKNGADLVIDFVERTTK